MTGRLETKRVPRRQGDSKSSVAVSSAAGVKWLFSRKKATLHPLPEGTVILGLPETGVTLIELIITIAILSILATAALPMVAIQVKRAKERQLRADLWEMRRAIDAYKDVADLGGIQTKADSNNYPPDLQTLVDGVEVKDKKMRFLRAIPVDPMTGSTEWGMRSNQDDPDSTSFGGQDPGHA